MRTAGFKLVSEPQASRRSAFVRSCPSPAEGGRSPRRCSGRGSSRRQGARALALKRGVPHLPGLPTTAAARERQRRAPPAPGAADVPGPPGPPGSGHPRRTASAGQRIVTWDRAGNIYVADGASRTVGNARIARSSAARTCFHFVKVMGAAGGSEPGQFNGIRGIVIDAQGNYSYAGRPRRPAASRSSTATATSRPQIANIESVPAAICVTQAGTAPVSLRLELERSRRP